jgi:hypothetical protein
MSEIYAVALSVSQGADDLNPTAFLNLNQDGRKTMLQLAWVGLPAIKADQDPGGWLLGVLETLVENFDDHHVLSAVMDGLDGMTEDTDA